MRRQLIPGAISEEPNAAKRVQRKQDSRRHHRTRGRPSARSTTRRGPPQHTSGLSCCTQSGCWRWPCWSGLGCNQVGRPRRQNSIFFLEEVWPNLLFLLLLGLSPLLPCHFAACDAACIFAACHRAAKIFVSPQKCPECLISHLARSPGNLRTHSMVLMVRTIGSVFSRVQGTWI